MLTNSARLAAYQRQTPGRNLTPKQRRRVQQKADREMWPVGVYADLEDASCGHDEGDQP